MAFASSKQHKEVFNIESLKKAGEKRNFKLKNSYWKHIKLIWLTDFSQNYFIIKYSPTSESLQETPGISSTQIDVSNDWLHP